MDIELHFDQAALARLMSELLRGNLRRACAPPLGEIYLDHLEVLPGATTAAAEGVAQIAVPLRPFTVTRAALLAAPNATPVIEQPFEGAVIAPLTLAIARRRPGQDGTPPDALMLTMAAGNPQLPAEAAAYQPVLDHFWPALRAAIRIPEAELKPLFDTLRRPLPNAGWFSLAGPSLVARFDAQGAAVPRLASGQQWGVFLPGAVLCDLLLARVRPQIATLMPGADVSAAYAVENGVPLVRLAVRGSASVAAVVLVELDATAALALGPGPSLQASVSWTLDLALDGLVEIPLPGFVEDLVADQVAEAIDPAQFGGISTGPRSFILPLALPVLGLGAAGLFYERLAAGPDGVVLGGRMRAPPVLDAPFDFQVSPFSPAARITNCAALAKTGSGERPRDPTTVYNTSTTAEVEWQGTDALCDIAYVESSDVWGAHLKELPGNGVQGRRLRFSASIADAMLLGGRLSLILRTPRGVRYVDFGRVPLPKRDAEGNIKDPLDIYIRNCLYQTQDGGRRWSLRWHGHGADFQPIPMEQPDWLRHLEAGGGLVVQMLTFAELDPGEFVQFRSQTHAIDATADAEGRLLLPVLLPYGALAPARLERASGRPIRGHVQVESASFQHLARLEGALGLATGLGAMRLTDQGRARYLWARGALVALNPQPLPRDRSEASALDPQPLPPDRSEATALNPEPLPPELPAGLGVVTRIPGFGEWPVAVAMRRPGEGLLLDLGGRSARVAGRFDGPFGPLRTESGLAVAHDEGTTALFRRMDLEAG